MLVDLSIRVLREHAAVSLDDGQHGESLDVHTEDCRSSLWQRSDTANIDELAGDGAIPSMSIPVSTHRIYPAAQAVASARTLRY